MTLPTAEAIKGRQYRREVRGVSEAVGSGRAGSGSGTRSGARSLARYQVQGAAI